MPAYRHREMDNFTTFYTESSITPAKFTTDGPESTAGDLGPHAFLDYFTELANGLNVYYTPILIILGCIGNLISIIVFFTSKLRLQSTSQYLSALALSDTVFLCQLLPPWLKAVDASGLFTMDIFCQVFVYLSYVSSNHSSWLVVAFTVERFVAVVYPLRRNAMCTVKRARHIILALAVISMLVNIPVLRFAVPSSGDCNIDYEFMEHAARFNLVDTMFSFTLPLAVIIVLNAWIMVGVYKLGRARRRLMTEEGTEGGLHPRAVAWQRSQQRVTRMLLVVSSVFVLLNLPAYTMRIVAYANDMSENEYSGKWAALQQICLLFFNTNFGINFFLYCMSGQNFRRALCHTFPWLGKRARRAVAVRRTTSHPTARGTLSTSFISTADATSNCTGTIALSSVGGGGCAALNTGGGRRLASLAPVIIKRRGRRRNTRVVRRWRFDNSRQLERQRSADLELQIQSSHTDM